MKYYISDLHLQHKNVLKYDDRPFYSIEKHDIAIIETINKTVGINDELYILGDISRKGNKSVELLKSIKCKNIFFLKGNHDFSKYIKIYEGLGRKYLGLMYEDKENKVVICHYPLEEWYHSRHKDGEGYIHIHGHSHGNGRNIENRYDVGFTFKEITGPITKEDLIKKNILGKRNQTKRNYIRNVWNSLRRLLK